VNGPGLGRSLRRIGADLPESPSLATLAMARGKALERRRRDHRRTVAAVTAVAAGVATFGALGPATRTASASVACYADRVVVRRAKVDAGRNGVHLRVVNNTGDAAVLYAGDTGAILPPGTTTVDIYVPPGEVSLTCATAAATSSASLTVTDRRHNYVREDLDCPRPVATDLRSGENVLVGDPVALTRERLAGTLPPRAVVEPAGYPAASDRRYVRVRVGTMIVGAALWHRVVARNAWTLDELRTCP
jgi:hypothetical protein